MTFPEGLNRTLALFSKATYSIINSDEIEKVKKSASISERKHIKMLQKALKGVKPENLILWALAPTLHECPMLLADILAWMVTLDDCTFAEDELKEFFTVNA